MSAAFPIVITLNRPVRFGDDDITELKLREPLAGDFRALTEPFDLFTCSFNLAAELAGVPASVIDRLGLDDTQAVIEAVNPFLFWFR
ncbi:phage tail assembly protein [Jeongeupia naejangsanensis]|uniref:Phage tail assembly protein n=1 Tax=Jeongeupia naejangsanensis TaxID=613195 RepID=A0ABS2BJI6_9NEIS|nr:phage tail assembly protein [Jeongeupia naejangsanensis]MBM3114994.1 phage tail assembly protein [Jeongeupia naejangsanensis]